MKLKATALVVVLTTFASIAFSQAPDSSPTTQPHDVSVTPDGKSIQATIDALARNSPTRQTVTFAPGDYRQRVEIHKDLINVTFRSEGKPEDVRIVTARAAGQTDAVTGKRIGTSGSEVVLVIGDGFTAENITFENDAGQIGQAVAVRTTGDRAVFRNCRFIGWQDTLYTNGKRHYFDNCYVEGRVDFIFGRATAVFENCTIKSKNGGYVTAASTNPETPFGLVFVNCKLISDDQTPTFLGRPWRPHSSVTYLNCEIGSHIRPEGWHNWGKEENEKTARYAEYGNTGPGADTSKRVAWAKQLTKEEADKITVESVLSGEDKWDPKSQK